MSGFDHFSQVFGWMPSWRNDVSPRSFLWWHFNFVIVQQLLVLHCIRILHLSSIVSADSLFLSSSLPFPLALSISLCLSPFLYHTHTHRSDLKEWLTLVNYKRKILKSTKLVNLFFVFWPANLAHFSKKKKLKSNCLKWKNKTRCG